MELSAKYKPTKIFGKVTLRFSEHRFIHLSWKWRSQTLWAKKRRTYYWHISSSLY